MAKRKTNQAIRNRIKDHRRVKAGDLIPHEHNPRTHDDAQREALAALYAEIGFARSLLAYEVQINGETRLKLIDGHLRASMDPHQEVDVEVLDVNDDEARKLLLSIDPLAQLAGYEQDTLDALRGAVTTDSDALNNLWQAVGTAVIATEEALEKATKPSQAKEPVGYEEKYLIIVDCRDEPHQRDLLRWLKEQGVKCTPKIA